MRFRTRPTNILFIVNDLTDISLNQACVTLASQLAKRSFSVRVVSLSGSGTLLNQFNQITVGSASVANNFLGGIIRVVKSIKEDHLDIIHTQTLRADYTAFLSRLMIVFSRRRVTHICVRRNYLFPKEKFRHKIKNLFYFLSCHLADLNICVARHLEEKLISDLRVPQAKVTTIANGVNFNRKLPPRQSTRTPLVIFTGRLIPRKNLKILVQALKNISLSFQCLIIGDGEDLLELKNYCQVSGIQDRVEFLGHKTDVAPYLSKSDIFVLPSLDEGLSWSLLEAMSCGLACVVSDADGNVELINNGYNGLVFKLRDGAAGLTKCLRQLIVDTKLRRRLSANAQKTVKENYSESAMITSYQNLYLRLANFDRATSAATAVR